MSEPFSSPPPTAAVGFVFSRSVSLTSTMDSDLQNLLLPNYFLSPGFSPSFLGPPSFQVPLLFSGAILFLTTSFLDLQTPGSPSLNYLYTEG